MINRKNNENAVQITIERYFFMKKTEKIDRTWLLTLSVRLMFVLWDDSESLLKCFRVVN